MSAAVEKRQQWINRQRAADNSVENTGALFPAVCEFIRPHAVPLVISKYMQLIWCRCINSVSGYGWLCRQIVCSGFSVVLVGGICQHHLTLFSTCPLLSSQLQCWSSSLGLTAAAELTLHFCKGALLCIQASRPVRQADWLLLSGPAPARPCLTGIRLTHLILRRGEGA